MATFFGEILPVTSRAFDDDDEDDNDTTSSSVSFIKWSPKAKNELEASSQNILKCSSLIIAVGPSATGFTEAYIIQDSYEKLGELVSERKDEDDEDVNQHTVTDRTCHIYRSQNKPGIIVCQCKTDVPPEEYFSWMEQIAKSLDLSICNVAVLCSAMTSEYKSDTPITELSPPFLHGLKTTHYTGSLACKVLEQPNMVTGLPAQVLSHCQVHGVKAAVYISYTDSIFLELPTMRSFKTLMKTQPFKDIAQSNSVGDKLLLKIVDQQINRSTLYL